MKDNLTKILKENRTLDFLHKCCWNNGILNQEYVQAYISKVNQLLGKGDLMKEEHRIYAERYKEMIK